MMFAIIAFDFPSFLGSLNPILILLLPFLSTFTELTPKESTSSPVDLDSTLVSLPTTDSRLIFTLSKTTSLPLSRTLVVISSVLAPNLDYFFRNSSGILTVALAIDWFHLFC